MVQLYQILAKVIIDIYKIGTKTSLVLKIPHFNQQHHNLERQCVFMIIRFQGALKVSNTLGHREKGVNINV